jgi:hypothetical protein
MQTFPAGAPAHAGGFAVVSEVLIGTVLHRPALVVLSAGYPLGMPPSEGGSTYPPSAGGPPASPPPEELLMQVAVPPSGSVQTSFTHVDVPSHWQSGSPTQSSC